MKAAAVDRIRRDLEVDRENYLERTKNLDMALAALAGVLAAAYVMFDMGLTLGGDGVVFLMGAALTCAVIGGVSFVSLRQWRERSFWTDGPQ